MPDWQAVRVFLELHRSGSYRSCARRLSMTVNSIRRHVDSLEGSLGVRLLTRHVDGVRLTIEGETLVTAALRMEREAIGLLRARDIIAEEEEGSVRVAVTEGIGAAWLAPRLAVFQSATPRLRIDLICGMTSADVLRMEAEVAVQLMRPEALDVKVVRLGYLHVMPYGSLPYLAENGTPTNIAELARHKLVLQLAEQTSTVEVLRRIFADEPFTGTIAMTTNVSSAHALAIANGAGIGWLPTYVSGLQNGLIPISCGAEARFDLWMTYHPDVEMIPRVRRTIEWIRASFDARLFPAFGEARINPADLPAMMRVNAMDEVFRSSAL